MESNLGICIRDLHKLVKIILKFMKLLSNLPARADAQQTEQHFIAYVDEAAGKGA